jgi:hypothetical protein
MSMLIYTLSQGPSCHRGTELGVLRVYNGDVF